MDSQKPAPFLLVGMTLPLGVVVATEARELEVLEEKLVLVSVKVVEVMLAEAVRLKAVLVALVDPAQPHPYPFEASCWLWGSFCHGRS